MKRTWASVFAALVFQATLAHADSLQSVAKHLSKGLTPLKFKRIAVLSFPYHNGDVSSGSSIVSERLTTLMVQRGGAEVVERALLDKTLEEVKLGMTGALDQATTQKLGKVLGVSAIVTGTLIDLEGMETEVNARMIETETGAILAAYSVRINRTWEDLPKPVQTASAATPRHDDQDSGVIMSKAIPTHGPRRREPPMFNGQMPPMGMEPGPGPGPDMDEDVLTLTDQDLLPVNHRGITDPERILNDYLADHGPLPPDAIRIARRIYHRNPSPRVRARALLAMGHILERTNQPDQASQAYTQILREFSDFPEIQTEARKHLRRVASR